MGDPVTTAIIVGATLYTAKESADTAEEQYEAQVESTEQTTAAQEVTTRENIRQSVRQDRIRRAQITQASEATGSAGSSAEAGTVANLSTNLSSNLALADGQINTAEGLTAVNKRLSQLDLRQQKLNIVNDLIGTGAALV